MKKPNAQKNDAADAEAIFEAVTRPNLIAIGLLQGLPLLQGLLMPPTDSEMISPTVPR
jgi:hypothetical protein